MKHDTSNNTLAYLEKETPLVALLVFGSIVGASATSVLIAIKVVVFNLKRNYC